MTLRLGKEGIYRLSEDKVRCGSGYTLNVLRAELILRANKQLIESIFYLYSSHAAAMAGKEEGGCGFLVQVKESSDQRIFTSGTATHYAVTANHVIQDCYCPVIRLNTQDGKVDTIQLAVNQWRTHPDCDLAVADLGFIDLRHFKVRTLARNSLITPDAVEALDISLGDGVYMIGRFVHHEGKQTNKPSVRSGIISTMADSENKVKLPNEPEQEAFLVEMRSISGYSGSPVVFHLPTDVDGWKVDRHMTVEPDQEGNYDLGPFLLGIDVGAFNYYNKLYAVRKEKDQEYFTKIDGYEVKSHAGVSIVIPAWKLAELLDGEEFAMARRERKKRFEQRIQHQRQIIEKHAVNEEEKELTRSDFEKALQRASSRVSEPESEKTRTSE
jgi:hypothetical protein